LAAEAEKADIHFEYDGVQYTVPHPKLWPLEAIEAQERGEVLGALKHVLGPAQYKKFKAKPRVAEDVDKISMALFDAADIELGESED
jgi:hypothetical protein